jgi:hypothetical protein
MERFWKRRNEGFDLESELRAYRPAARDEFVRTLGDHVRASRRSHARLGIAFAACLTALLVAALVAFGGVGYAAAGAERVASTAQKAFGPSSKPARQQQSPAQDQYRTTICHRTESAKNPWVEITVSDNALTAHQRHGDIIPAPPGGCPTTP